ncbi:MAG: hypothetical protein QOG21_1122 [Actinomycetota bacterium]|jgi:hypothetical protein|nr:hypothetical protein [Actinomycetota bacterium]
MGGPSGPPILVVRVTPTRSTGRCGRHWPLKVSFGAACQERCYDTLGGKCRAFQCSWSVTPMTGKARPHSLESLSRRYLPPIFS